MKTSAEVVICGVGIAGVATAYMLAERHGVRDILLLDERPPLTLTSDKSTECYRNWWPGPGDEMVAMMNRSIDIMEDLADKSGNIFHLNRRGYLYVTTQKENMDRLSGFAEEASGLGAGEVREHMGMSSGYIPHNSDGYEKNLDGADLLTDPKLIHAHFPYLSEEVEGALHVRRAGWLSAQQYGMYLLDEAKKLGVQMLQARIEEVEISGGKVSAVKLDSGQKINTQIFVNAAGPMLDEIGKLLEVEIPVFNELHLKATIHDSQGVLDRKAPMVISADEQILEWSDVEAQMLLEDEETQWLVESLPSGAHTRPEGDIGAENILILWDTHDHPRDAIFPPPLEPMLPEVALRGLCRMIPGFEVYLGRMPKPFIDGGYYTKTKENRPLAGALDVEGAYVIGAMSGYGIMAAAALAELTADTITNALPQDYAPAFSPSRYSDPKYQQMLENWGDSWQL